MIAGSFCLSSIIWIFNSLNKDITTKFTVPLKIHFNASSYIPLRLPPKELKAEINGRGWHILRALYFQKNKPMVIWLKHPGLHSSIDTLSVKDFLRTNLIGIKIKKVLIDSTAIPFELRTHKRVFMNVDLKSIDFAKGYDRVGEIIIDPDSVLITGPQSIVEAIPDTLKIDIPYHGLDHDFDESLLLSYFLNNTYLQLSHEKVRVQFKVSKVEVADEKE